MILFAGRCARVTRKKSPTFKFFDLQRKDRNHLLAARGGGAADTVPKGHPQKIGLEEASEGSPFQSSASFLAKIGAAGCRCLESSPPFERMGDEHTYPSFPKWLKSSVERLSEKGCAQCSDRGFGRYTEVKTARNYHFGNP